MQSIPHRRRSYSTRFAATPIAMRNINEEMALQLRSLALFSTGGMRTGEMAKAPFRRSWRGFYDRLLKDERYQRTFDTDKYGPYRTYRKIFIQIDRVLKRYPRQITPISIGTSVGGEPIWIFRVDNAADDSKKPVSFLVTSLIHSIEYIGVEANVSFLERFTSNMKQNPALHNRVVHFLPILNPDGYLDVESDLAGGRSRFRRRNRNGVDLNRNFSAFFSRRYLMHRTLRGIYHPGHRPFSEPESSALRSHLLENRFDYALSLHAFGGKFLFPYGGTRDRSRFDGWYRELGRVMANHQPFTGYKTKQLGRQFPLFLARGTESDYLHETFGTRSMLVEIYKSGGRLLNPLRLFDPFLLFNPKDPQKEIDNLMESFFYFLSLDGNGRIR